MKPKESLADRLAREAAQAIVRHEILGWPPDSPWGTYQPHRPEAPLPQPLNNRAHKKNGSRKRYLKM